MSVECWFDGGCGPVNPGGHATFGAIVKVNGSTTYAKSGYVGFGPEMSNNVAEYAGAISVMEHLIENNIRSAIIFGDSKLVVLQLNRKWKAKKGLYFPFYQRAAVLRLQLPHVEIRHIRRHLNTEADALARRSYPEKETRPVEQRRQLVKLIKAQKADARDRHLRFDHAIERDK